MDTHILDIIKNLSVEYAQDIIDIRHHLHQYPELSFQEKNTTSYIKQQLEKEGIQYTDRYLDTGVVAWIRGKSKEFISLRADIDALPITENTQVPYASKNEGIMHACGHDVHTSCALGAMKILKRLESSLPFSVVCYFQPGEEKLPGGALQLIEAGALDDFPSKYIIGQHVSPELPVGSIGIKPGIFMASADEIYITIKGKGGHAAAPHKNNDVVLTASQCIVQLQTLVSRYANPITPTVLSFGKVNTDGGATNVLPSKISLEGTFRTFDEKWRNEAHQHIQDIVHNVASSYHCEAKVDILKGYPCLHNDEQLTNDIKRHFSQYLGNDMIIDLDARMTAEDFAYYSQKMPACFYRLGTGGTNPSTQHNVHSPYFDIDEDALQIGAGLLAWSAFLNLKMV
ncbi:MAG: amidohydrolase [Lewinellaceae bacterium]|nr:amidohydrolase [Lewinellaceae bacterium]